MFGTGHKLAGVSIEQNNVRYIRFKNNNPKQIHKKRSLSLNPGLIVENQVADREALVDQLRQWVKTKGLRGSEVNLSIPPSQMIIRKMTIPSIVDKQIGQLVRLEVETGLHLPFENPVFDYVITGQGENESELVLFAAPRKIVQDYVSVMEEAGLKIKSVEISATALARSIVAGYGHAFNETMLIHLEQSLLDIYMFKGGNPIFMRTIDLADLGRGRPQESVEALPFSAELEVAATTQEHISAEQMVEITAEISRMLSFYQYSLHDGSTRITEVLITGSPTMRQDLQTELQQALPELAIAQVAADQFAQGAKPDYSLNDYRVAAGAALKSQAARSIDLLPREDREAILFPYLALALVMVWILGAAATGMWYATARSERTSQTHLMESLQQGNQALQAKVASLSTGSTTAGGMDREAIIKAISAARADAAGVLDELQKGLPYGAVIREISYAHNGDLMLTVNYTAMNHSADYLTALRGMSFTVSAAIEKLTEGATASSGTVSNMIKYTAVYRVSMAAPQVTAETQPAAGEEADSVGTNQ
ncbi:pilus assembly protein PilM [Paenibacillus sp. NFR01]|uniref:pilus assembly protein PilM n=1 Tax=Paenibacillus sp. NFR01 TaxID=1566279 RepID=UPI0008CDE8CE|nr:pilus assembly protein PilM [Paenibacillus sp. NFR01]SEU14753.1 type IV pilus assembly protein PilM [Paenibacillus sp. NFR01]